MTAAPVTCPKCGKTAKKMQNQYGVRHTHCGLSSWNGRPLVTQETLNARIAAHAAFDTIWKEKLISRSEAYKRLAAELGMTRKDCHISLMDEAQAKRVPIASENIRALIGVAACKEAAQ